MHGVKKNSTFNTLRSLPSFFRPAATIHTTIARKTAATTTTRPNMSLEAAKKLAAYKAVDQYVTDNMVLGIGSGSTIVFAVERLRQRVRDEKLDIVCIPTSFQARQLIIQNGLRLGQLDITPVLDCAIDGADEVDEKMTLIKGGGGCLLQEKIIASCAKQLIIVADYTKDSKLLAQQYKRGVAIEVIPLAYVPITNKIEEEFGGTIKLRMAVEKAGPCVTDNGNLIIDWQFPTDKVIDWSATNAKLIGIPGVVETGLFIDMAHHAFFGQADGTVVERWNPNSK